MWLSVVVVVWKTSVGMTPFWFILVMSGGAMTTTMTSYTGPLVVLSVVHREIP